MSPQSSPCGKHCDKDAGKTETVSRGMDTRQTSSTAIVSAVTVRPLFFLYSFFRCKLKRNFLGILQNSGESDVIQSTNQALPTSFNMSVQYSDGSHISCMFSLFC